VESADAVVSHHHVGIILGPPQVFAQRRPITVSCDWIMACISGRDNTSIGATTQGLSHDEIWTDWHKSLSKTY